MTDTAVTYGDSPLRPDGDPPMLPSLPAAAALPTLPTSTSTVVPNLPVVPNAGLSDPHYSGHDVGNDDLPLDLPSLPERSLPVLPASGPVGSAAVEIPHELVAEVVAGEPEKRDHPMAHLMPEKQKPNEVSLRAAQQRAARKTRSRRIKIVVAIVAVAIAAVAGPPLVSWLVDSVNQAGSTPADTTDEPVEQSIDDLLQDGPAAGLDAIDDAKQVVGDTTP